MNWDYFWRTMADSYYLLFPEFILSLFVSIMYLVKPVRFKGQFLIFIHTFCSTLQYVVFTISIIFFLDIGNLKFRITNTAIQLFFLIEGLVCAIFISKQLKSVWNKKILNCGIFVFILVSLHFFISIRSFYNSNYYTYCQAILILLACSLYIEEMFRLKEVINPLKTPAFLVISGILFVTLCNLPLLVLDRIISSYRMQIAYLINIIPILTYLLLHIIYLIAILCKSNAAK